MIGYHDCPPHPLESLHSEHDAKWKRRELERAVNQAIDLFPTEEGKRRCAEFFLGITEIDRTKG